MELLFSEPGKGSCTSCLGHVFAHCALRCLQTLNDTFSDELKRTLGSPGDAVSDAAFISIDRLGTDVRVRQGTDYSVQRLGFEQARPRTAITLSCSV